ncbi:hypothetical protein ACGF1Z_31295 [Streptomyces sp. NPDC048018]|uniref:hypothetical protein n=1 Tax=Streptomyces sp. NPDC048018 TaxID=3365499 RepID=UPI00371EDA62
MTTLTTPQQFEQIARLWPDLRNALAAPTQHSWPPVELRGYLQAMERLDIDDPTAYNAARRELERDPAQLGVRPIPISLAVHDTMRAVEAALLDTADRIARSVQRTPIQPPAPARASYAQSRGERLAWEDRARRIRAARADACDPRRWQPQQGRTAIRAALWLSGRAAGLSGPFRPLSDVEQQHVAKVAAGALARVERALDLADAQRQLSADYACQCGGQFEIYGGNGARPCARCKGCGVLVHEGGVVAA